MKIQNKEELLKRLEQVITAVSIDERYPESLDVLSNIKKALAADDCDICEAEKSLACGLHDADGAHPMHPDVAKLLICLYEDGIEKKDADAMCNLGALYYSGRAGEQNYEKAAYYYDLADKAGNRQATENLGYIYYYGRIGQRDYEKAFKYFVKGALDAHLRSLYKVGDFYKNGYYVEKDPVEAFHIYQHCTNMLSDEAIPLVGADIYMRMGDCFYEGFGVEKNLLIAQRFMSAAENMFYRRLADGDFYQKHNLRHVLDVLEKIRKEIKDSLPDLSWSDYNG